MSHWIEKEPHYNLVEEVKQIVNEETQKPSAMNNWYGIYTNTDTGQYCVVRSFEPLIVGFHTPNNYVLVASRYNNTNWDDDPNITTSFSKAWL